ncbi:hypothetical protein RF11_16502 [Thelohanellus kitauei]|uniref:Tc1-like transposase DDE domain-containing protein n=1 Tax=Thelohanellus kitauei TaxID=669202 RepID=A0A0C2MDK6_THEKT|nr:hypothetical protein RF11_00351 [Thelohanellus kitauei]KII70658.1 hypothetical protein RF11_16502 [Thelohanellus kitauei]
MGTTRSNSKPNKTAKGPNVTMLLAISGSNWIHCQAVASSVNSTRFIAFMNSIFEILGQDENFTIVMDNVNFHYSRELPQSDKIPYRYLPAYSPFLNPCEEVFSHIKNNVRRNTAPTGRQDLIERMTFAANQTNNINLSNYFSHSESFFEKCSRQENIGRD